MKYKNKIINLKSLAGKILLVFTIFIMHICFISATQLEFQMEWGNVTSDNETWVKIDLKNFYQSPVVVTGPEYSGTTNIHGISTWVTNITSNSFMLRTSDENFGSVDDIMVHYIVMEKGKWTLPDSGIKVEAGIHTTSKVGSISAGWNCPTVGDTITFSHTFDNNPLFISNRATNNNPNAWAVTFQHDPALEASPVTTTQACLGLSQSKAISPGIITVDEDIHWIAADEGNGTINGVEYEILWNQADTGDSGGNWINGYADSPPFTQSWAHTWNSAPNIIIPSQTSVGGTDGSWPVIYDTGSTLSIRMFVDEANERAHSGSESGGGWAFNTSGSFSILNITISNVIFNETELLIPNRIDPFNRSAQISAIVTESRSNSRIQNVIASIIHEYNASKINISLSPETINGSYVTSDIESSNRNYTGSGGGDLIGETGEIILYNRSSQIIAFTNTYSQTPVIIAITSTQNNNDNPYIPIIYSINTTHANISLCRDAGATTCDNNYLAETVNYAVFDVNRSNNYSWIEVGRVSATTNGGTTGFTFNKTFSNTPYIFALPQTYNIGSSGIAAHSWFTSVTTTGANIVACDHPGTSDSCGGSATESFGYVAIDPVTFAIENAESGTESIGNSAWTSISFTRTYTDANVFVMVNSENGGQDPAYPWARTVTASGADIRYCEIDGINDCDTHNSEDTRWLALETGDLTIGGGSYDNDANATLIPYFNVFSDNLNIPYNITIEINISTYNSSGTDSRSNKLPDLRVEFFDGLNNWVNLGEFEINSTGSYRLSIINSTVMNAWIYEANRDIRIEPIYFDYVSPTTYDQIIWDNITFYINETAYTSNWSATYEEFNTCGYYNITDVYSTNDLNFSIRESYTNKSMLLRCPADITLINPINNAKIISYSNITFEWNFTSYSSNFTCGLYLNSVLNQSINCSKGIDLNLTQYGLSGGDYNWSINVTDEYNLTHLATFENFTLINYYYSTIRKTIVNAPGNDIFTSRLNVSNELNLTQKLYPNDFVENSYSYGSFNVAFDWLFTPPTPTIYNGTIIGWNLSLAPYTSTELNYSIARIGSEYDLLDVYVTGLD